MLITWAWSWPIGVWKYSALNLAIHFHIAFVLETWLVGFALQRVKKEETSLVSEATPKATQYNTKLTKAVEKSSRKGSSDGKIHVQC